MDAQAFLNLLFSIGLISSAASIILHRREEHPNKHAPKSPPVKLYRVNVRIGDWWGASEFRGLTQELANAVAREIAKQDGCIIDVSVSEDPNPLAPIMPWKHGEPEN